MYNGITESYNVYTLYPYINLSFSSACSVLHNHILYEDFVYILSTSTYS